MRRVLHGLSAITLLMINMLGKQLFRLVAGLAAFVSCLTLTTLVRADNVGINFVGGSTANGTPSPLGSGEAAGFIAQQNWNSAQNSSGTISGLYADDGGGIGIYYGSGFAVSWSDVYGIRSTPIADGGGNSRLMKGFLNSDNTISGSATITVSGVPLGYTSRGYAVIVYFDGDNPAADRVSKFSVNASLYGTKTLYGLDKAGVSFSGTFKQVPSSSTTDLGSGTPDGNFVIFPNLTDTSFTLTVSGGSASDGNARGALNAIQIVPMSALPAPPAPVITSAGTATGTINVAFSYVITANNGPTSFSAAGLPSGLTVNSANGTISGVPTLPGTYNVTLGATNSGGTGTKALTLTIGSGFSMDQSNTVTTNDLTGITLLDLDHGALVGSNGTVLVTTNGGSTWQSSNIGSTNHPTSIRFVGPYIYLTGLNGLLGMSGDYGLSWRFFLINRTNSFYSLSFFNPFSGFAVGIGGIICFYDGWQWVVQPTGLTVDFYGVQAIGPTAYAVGGGGTICRYDGANWIAQNSGVPAVTFYDVAFLNENFGYVVGANGTICRTTDGGANWVQLNSGTTETLRGIRVADANTAWAVGDNGVVLVITDGGVHWTLVPLGILTNWYAIDFLNGRGVIVGGGGSAYFFQQTGYALNYAPLIVLLAPSGTLSNIVCSKIPFVANAYDSDGFLSKVEFFVGANKIGQSVGWPYRCVWTNRTLGTYTCIAKATDNLGATAYSAPVSLTVTLPPGGDQLRALTMLPTNAFEFCLCGETGRVYTVQTSANLTNWIYWRTVTNQTGVVPIVDGSVSNIAHRFYHATHQ